MKIAGTFLLENLSPFNCFFGDVIYAEALIKTETRLASTSPWSRPLHAYRRAARGS